MECSLPPTAERRLALLFTAERRLAVAHSPAQLHCNEQMQRVGRQRHTSGCDQSRLERDRLANRYREQPAGLHCTQQVHNYLALLCGPFSSLHTGCVLQALHASSCHSYMLPTRVMLPTSGSKVQPNRLAYRGLVTLPTPRRLRLLLALALPLLCKRHCGRCCRCCRSLLPAAAAYSSQFGLHNAGGVQGGQDGGAHDAPELVVDAAGGQEVRVGGTVVQLQKQRAKGRLDVRQTAVRASWL